MKNKSFKIAPSILAADLLNLEKEVIQAQKFGAYRISVDVMDGNFVPDITFGPNLVSQLKKILDIDIEVHLMVNNPESKINSFNQAGADVLTFHYESVNDSIEKTITEIKNLNCRVGLAINPDTEVNEIQKYLPDLDEVTVMTVVPGKGGQKLIQSCLLKVEQLVEISTKLNLNYLIQIDGGVKKENIQSVIKSGADIAVAGTSVFNNESVEYNMKSLLNSL